MSLPRTTLIYSFNVDFLLFLMYHTHMNLTLQQNPEWALFLPALSSFYIAGISRDYEQARIPAGLQDIKSLDFLKNSTALFPYKWALYSAGHADLKTYKTNPTESIVVDRDPDTFILADSGGFQILKCQWPADWKDPNCPRAAKKRKEVLNWMDDIADYGMCLDIPSQSLSTYHIKDPKTGKSAHGISTIEEAITATHINNEYFIQNRSGKCKFLNVLQGRNHSQSDSWYEEMKKYCDTNIYPNNHFNGWAFGGQNKIDIHLMLKRLVGIIFDGLLQEGKHDLIHCLGTSILEYAVLFSDIQKAIRKYHNPKLTITFDCASPFYSAAKGLAYNNTVIEHDKKWTYSMEKTAENKQYSTDGRKFSDAVLNDKIHKLFADSPVTERLKVQDLCYRGVGFIGQHGKETKTSWDTLSYTLLQSHNVYRHMVAVQEANRKYDQGVIPKMLMNETFDRVLFKDLVDSIFKQTSKEDAMKIIEDNSKFWMQIRSGSQGFSGKKSVNAMTMFDSLFEEDTNEPEETEIDYQDEPIITDE